ncbi:hypothetical protein ECP03023084_1850 [Escherichia coli P0302308.4]|nr:hypothetical protein ECDEC15A_2258 [Escherichia coli DEC15A]EHY07837.1 hypothetical protein ECDEC15C_1975 [Escherichia coli DEC15C]EHY15314.1 hypothetical protein ECDEC15D_1908 [Escherichia coli DEC15D]EIE55128.1 hypothetical protein ECAI27_26890 [Escherichia coli AI27]EMX06913.1 hypothetical protein ECP03023081_2397 [Escherichia coli P0302308.1]ENC99282.1 hypothetical protein ECP030230810_1918 [Escherichia coli P0302308.10]END04531.1 hypothetical protein ECP030230811_1719 [Escherichia col
MRQLWRKKENLMESDERILQHDDFAEIMKNYTGWLVINKANNQD